MTIRSASLFSSPPSSTLRTALVALLLALHWWLGLSAVLTKGITNDESAHLTAGYSYWKFNDYRLQPENGNLPQRWAALPLLWEEPRMDPSAHPEWWAHSDVWIIGNHLLYESGNTPDFMLATGRAMIGLLSVATGLLVFLWSRHLWGDWGGLFSLVLYVFSATALAHGYLVTSDACATLTLVAATGAFWRYLQKPGKSTLTLSVVLTGLAAVSKFSFLLLGPVFVCLGLWHLACRPDNRRRHFFRLLAVAGAHALGATLIIWAAFGFRYSAYSEALPVARHYYFEWTSMVPAEGLRSFALNFLRDHHLLPEAFIVGLAHVLHASEARLAFAAGQYSLAGWWWFFPYAFLVKTPTAELLAFGATLAAGAAFILRSGRRGFGSIVRELYPFAPLLILLLVYWAAAVTSHLNIGHRHLLPVYPLLFILAGALLRKKTKLAWRIGAAGVALFAAADALYTYPNYLAYFNASVGGSKNGWKHLVDSSLDWGQELPALSAWLKENHQPKQPTYLSYFGLGNPLYEGIEAKDMAAIMPPWRFRTLNQYKPGVYCISATMLQDVYGSWRGAWDNPKENTYQRLLAYYKQHPGELADPKAFIIERGSPAENQRWRFERARFARLCTYLRIRKPDAVINSSLFIYKLDARETALTWDAPPSELADLIEQALDQDGVKARP